MDEEGCLISRVRRKAGSAKRRLVYALRSWQIIDLYVMQVVYAEAPAVAGPDMEIAVKELTEEDEIELAAVADFHFYGHSKDDLVKFLRAGQHCRVAEYDGRPIACSWVATGDYYDDYMKRWFRFADDEEYLLGGYTVPAFRGLGILTYLVEVVSEERVRKCRGLKAITFVRTNNMASLKQAGHMGSVRTGRVGFIECFGIRWNFLIGRGVLPKTVKRNFISLPAWK